MTESLDPVDLVRVGRAIEEGCARFAEIERARKRARDFAPHYAGLAAPAPAPDRDRAEAVIAELARQGFEIRRVGA